ncbi:MAG TPA: PspC domain-containing protein [Burkholderiaceae bacterium]|jgi:phage shock protein PspC (stress-responsive transcriptional regulator)|nr:PspC domain-containing protein [Burkholderiaceae bacterium]
MSESDELARLAELHQRAKLSDDEFTRAKARVLSGAAAARYQSPALGAINAFRRSRTDRWLGGVCAGLGQVTGAPAWIWRLLFTLLVLCAGTGVIVYVLMWIFVPLEAAHLDVGQAAAP